MIYLDTSVALAELFAEDRKAPDALWAEPLISSRLLEYELWARVQARRAAETHGEAVRQILARVSMVELAPPVLPRRSSPSRSPYGRSMRCTSRPFTTSRAPGNASRSPPSTSACGAPPRR